MPRTKMARKKSSVAHGRSRTDQSLIHAKFTSASPSDELPDEFSTLVANFKTDMDFMDAVNAYYDDLKAELKAEYERKCEIIKITISKEVDLLSASKKDEQTKKSDSSDLRKRRSHSLEFKKPLTPPKARPKKSESTTRKRSRSATPSSRCQTPLMSRRILPGTTITPKVFSNTPMTVMRRPLQGEIAVSITGSPLMVSAVSSDVPTVNVPLLDGRVFSIMPEKGEVPLDFPGFDEDTREQLKLLRDNLSQLLPDL